MVTTAVVREKTRLGGERDTVTIVPGAGERKVNGASPTEHRSAGRTVAHPSRV
jgi:hypothetical protein